jgi:hypothetical protein
MSPDPAPFAEHFDAVDATPDVTAFPNLGGDAYLIVPSPRAAATAYPHLAAFARNAPHAQQDALWHAVGLALDARVENRPIWLSTAGLGVAWVHVRLDTSPKYYRHGPYLAGR